MITFFKGMIIGIAMAAPVGPLALLCIRRSLTKGYIEGLATALGVALADGFYALIAALGLTAVSSFVLEKKEYLFMGGGILLIMLGARALRNPPSFNLGPLQRKGFLATLLQTSIITLTNPMTIVTFIAAFAAVGFEGQEHDLAQAITICLGVFTGSMIWFMLLSFTAAYLRTRVTPYMLWLINAISGSLLIIFGLLFLLDAAWELLAKVYA